MSIRVRIILCLLIIAFLPTALLATASIYNLSFTPAQLVFIAWIVFLAAIALGLYVASGITTPILQLTKEANRIRAGMSPREIAIQKRGEIAQLVQSFSTMTQELERSYEQLRWAQLMDEVTIRSIGEGIVVTTERGEISIVNHLAEKMLGMKDTQLVGKLMHLFITLENNEEKVLPSEKYPLIAVLQTGKTVKHYGFVSTQHQPVKIPVAITASPLLLAGKVIGVVHVFHDITTEREIEKSKDEFLAIAAHQLRTPLGSMRWNLERLLSGRIVDAPKPVKTVINQVYTSDLQMITLVNDLLEVSRINQGRVKIKPIATDVGALVKEVIITLAAEAKKKMLTVRLELPPKPLLPVSLDPQLFRQIVQNLFSNAVKYTEQYGSISVRLSSDSKALHFFISDTGIGIPKAEQNKLFTKFSRGSNAQMTDAEGTGLGLFVVKSFVTYLNGKIKIHSEEGKGTAITVEIPVKSK